MFCTKCGASYEEGETVCKACGAELPGGEASVEGAVQTEGVNYVIDGGYVDAYPAPEAPARKKNIGKKIAVALVSAVLVIGIVIGGAFLFFPKQTKNLAKKLFYSDLQYFRAVMKDEIAKRAGDVSDNMLYNIGFNGLIPKEGRLTVKANANDAFFDLLGDAAFFDAEWLKGITVELENNGKDDVSEGEARAVLSDKRLLTLDYRVDRENGVYYLRIPELSDDYIAADLGTLVSIGDMISNRMKGTDDDFSRRGYLPSFISLLTNGIPINYPFFIDSLSPSEFEAFINKYTGIALDNIDAVNVTPETVEIDGVSEKFTSYTVDLSEEKLIGIIGKICAEMKEDEMVGRIIDKEAERSAEKIAKMAAEYGLDSEIPDKEQIKEEIYSYFDNIIDGSAEYRMINGDYSVTMLIEDDGTIGGSSLSINRGENSIEVISLKKAEAGDRTAFFLQYDRKYVRSNLTMTFSGVGEKDGDLFTGDASFRYESEGETMELFKISFDGFDVESSRNNMLNGKIVINPGKDIGEMLYPSDTVGIIGGSSASLIVPTLSASVDMKYESGVQYFDVKAEAAGQSILVIELAYDQNGSEVGEADPEGSVSVYSTEEFEKWLQTCDLEAFFERLKEAGMPESLINEAKEKISK